MTRLIAVLLSFLAWLPSWSEAQRPPVGLRWTAQTSGPTPEPFAQHPPAAWQDQDPADSLYQSARRALNRNDYSTAANLFRRIRSSYPRSAYVPDSYYWEAYARYKLGGLETLREARRLLEEQTRRYPRADTRSTGDARSLEAQINGQLAQLGDEEAAGRVSEAARRAADLPPTPPAVSTPTTTATPPVGPGPRGRGPRRDTRCDDDDDVQSAALHALQQMDADRAIPILQRVLARRDAGSECLRRKAIFIVSQQEGPETERILLSAARSDPDPEVRSQAVFWLSQVDSPRAVVALDSILAAATDPELQDKAIFALSQHDSPEARRALRRFAERNDAPEKLRESAVFWLGQSDDAENVRFLQSLYPRVSGQALKEKIIFSVSQSDAASSSWFADIARNQSEPIEMRKQALFWMGQRDETTGVELASIYGTFADREIKEHLIFVLSQKDDRAAVDKLVDIARREPDRELRKKAIFWLTQTDDPRVADLLAELLSKP